MIKFDSLLTIEDKEWVTNTLLKIVGNPTAVGKLYQQETDDGFNGSLSFIWSCSSSSKIGQKGGIAISYTDAVLFNILPYIEQKLNGRRNPSRHLIDVINRVKMGVSPVSYLKELYESL
jgi:hypothetical protein